MANLAGLPLAMAPGMNTQSFAIAALSFVALAACAVDDDPSDEGATESAASSLGETVTGSLSASGTSWTTHTLDIPASGDLTLTLDWSSASANLNLFLIDPNGETVAFQNGSAKPEVLTFHVSEPGAYKVGIKAKSGSASYTLTSDFIPDAVVYDFAGTIGAGQWLTQTFQAEAGQSIEAVLSWATVSTNLNVFLYDPSGALVDAANSTTDRPETVAAIAHSSGTWKIGIKAKTGSSAYDLHVEVGGDSAPPEEPSYPGRPADGTLYWGAAIAPTFDFVARHEVPADHPLTLHRTFYQWNQRTGSLVTKATDDLAHGRLPWVSVKTPSWAAMAAGQHDQEIDSMLTALDALDGPVWLTIHHEPEGGGGVNAPDDPGGPAAHVGMNRRVRERMTALGVDNVALAPILMSYTWKPASGRDPEEWWAPGIYDFLGVDHYQDSESSMLDASWSSVRAFAEEKGVEVAVGEWGMRGTNTAAGARMKAFYDHAAGSYADGLGARVVGLSYFDSGQNSPSGTWELKGAQLSMFHTLLNDPRTADPQ